MFIESLYTQQCVAIGKVRESSAEVAKPPSSLLGRKIRKKKKTILSCYLMAALRLPFGNHAHTLAKVHGGLSCICEHNAVEDEPGWRPNSKEKCLPRNHKAWMLAVQKVSVVYIIFTIYQRASNIEFLARLCNQTRHPGDKQHACECCLSPWEPQLRWVLCEHELNGKGGACRPVPLL